MADAAQQDADDFAIVAWREDGRWQASSLPPHVLDDLDLLVRALHQQPAEGGTLGMVAMGDDFFLLARVWGPGVPRLLLSDITAAVDWPLAQAALDMLEVPVDDDDLDEVMPGGDLGIFSDLGLDSMELGALCEDPDLFPDEALEAVAERLGFGAVFSQALDAGER